MSLTPLFIEIYDVSPELDWLIEICDVSSGHGNNVLSILNAVIPVLTIIEYYYHRLDGETQTSHVNSNLKSLISTRASFAPPALNTALYPAKTMNYSLYKYNNIK